MQLASVRAVAALLCLLTACARQPQAHVAAAISLEPWLGPLLVSKAAAVTVSYGASGILERQIAAGAPVDVFLSASPIEVDALGPRVLERREIARNRLVLALSRDGAARVHGPADLASSAIHRIAVGRPQSVPAGRYAQQTLERLALWKPLLPKLIFADHVAEVRAWVERGDAEAGFIYESEAAGLRAVLPLPSAPEVRVVAALLNGTPAAREIYGFLASPDRLPSLRAAGLAPP
ncbi:MAG: molybdate ABC transporter substrate-binding protein [Myxococcales bacterium]